MEVGEQPPPCRAHPWSRVRPYRRGEGTPESGHPAPESAAGLERVFGAPWQRCAAPLQAPLTPLLSRPLVGGGTRQAGVCHRGSAIERVPESPTRGGLVSSIFQTSPSLLATEKREVTFPKSVTMLKCQT